MIDKALGGALAVIAMAPAMFSNDLTTPIIGVGLTAIGGALLGTGAAITADESRRPRGRMFALGTSTFVMTIFLVGVVPHWAGWEWTNSKTEFGLSGIAAFLCFFVLPPAAKRAGEIARHFKLSDVIPGLRRRDDTFTPPGDNYPPGYTPPPEGPAEPEDPRK